MAARVWTKDDIKVLLQTNDKMVSKSVVKLYEYQTSDEQDAGETNVHNGAGFNSRDAGFLSSIAKQIMSGRSITEKQLNATRKALFKYSGQLARIANIKAQIAS